MQKSYIKSYKILEEKHWWWQSRRKIITQEIKKLSTESKKPLKDLLDIGCGAGYTLGELKERFNCTGIEPENSLAKIARKNSKGKIIKGYLPNGIPSLKKKFDLVLLLDVLEHIEDDKRSLDKIRTLLSDDGYLLINVPAMHWLWSVHDVVNEHKRRYEREELKKLLTSAGFQAIKIRYWSFMLTPFAYFVERRFLKAKSEGKYKVFIPPKIINSLIRLYTNFEYLITRNVSLPFGLSMFAVAKKVNNHD